MKTSDKTSAELAALIEKHHADGPTDLHERIVQTFRVVGQPAPRAEQPRPEAGQTWRNRTSGRRVRIREIQTFGWHGKEVLWECIDGSRGQKTGSVGIRYWTERFEFEGSPDA